MRVLHLLLTSGWGGLERYGVRQARLSAASGVEQIFFCREGTPLAKELAHETGIVVEPVSPKKYIDAPFMMALRNRVKRERVDLLHVHSSGDLGLAAPALLGSKTALLFSSYMRIPAPKKDFYHRAEYGRVNCIVTASHLLAENARKNLPVAPERVRALPYGLDLTRFDPHREKGAFRRGWNIPLDAPLIGVISRLEPLKGQMEMIEALPEILLKQPRTVLALVGDETPELVGQVLPSLKRAVIERGLEESVIFTGYADDTTLPLADFDIYLLPSHDETYSLGCLEAMAMGKAIVGADSGGTPEMLGDGEYGRLARNRDPHSFADEVIRLLGDFPLRSRLGKRAREYVVANHDERGVTERRHALYEELIEQSR